MNSVNKILEIFIDEIPTEDFMHLKHTMTNDEICRFIDSWVEKYAPRKKEKSSEKSLTMKKNFLLRVIVEEESSLLDDDA